MNNIDFVGEDPTIEDGVPTSGCLTSNQDMINHNNLGNIQGGTLNERYHLTLAQLNTLPQVYTVSDSGTPLSNATLNSDYPSATNGSIVKGQDVIYQLINGSWFYYAYSACS